MVTSPYTAGPQWRANIDLRYYYPLAQVQGLIAYKSTATDDHVTGEESICGIGHCHKDSLIADIQTY
jgi:hypothetical protein